MNKLYNNFDEVASDMFNYFKNCIPSISKNHLKFLPYIILGMVDSESVVTSDISSSINSRSESGLSALILIVNPFNIAYVSFALLLLPQFYNFFYHKKNIFSI